MLNNEPRISTSSSSTEDFFSPISAVDSSSALILVHDDDDGALLDFSTSESDFGDNDESQDNFVQVPKASSPPLNPSLVFMYLLSPCLKLGAMFLPYSGLQLKCGILALVSFALLAALARHILYMLARYFRQADVEDVVIAVLARGRQRERSRFWIRNGVRAAAGLSSVLIASLYLRESVHIVVPLLSQEMIVPARVLLTVIFVLLLLPLSTAPSYSSRRVISSTIASLITYLIWLGCVSYAHAHGAMQVSTSWLHMGSFWQGITVTAFSFTSTSTLSLYASLRGGSTNSALPGKAPPTHSFKLLSLVSVLLATLLILPLVFFAASPNDLAIPRDTPSTRMHPFILWLNALALLFGLPFVFATAPTFPLPERIRRATNLPISKFIVFAVVVAVSFLPSNVSSVLSDAALVCALVGTYTVPAVIHISAHFFARPLSIIMPQRGLSRHERQPDPEASPSPAHDELLQRKERALQKRQLRKRIVWDVIVWMLLLPITGGGCMWVWGRLAGRW
ncbi:hypothetical protein FISHEDRAFT_49921 [Fistulina hepatica ATCC 64428]|uniref:Amino acid transporter transmembrane domain-containing protein n=1 Tax=Fistulina hepatica ATCC 64428 TaxID=1128425 RepID=A0A0D7A5L4_9AGAR|nr:hypothetical protein FISHEDRAFT_49921 [Fistulina hepatica ATCC 64428]